MTTLTAQRREQNPIVAALSQDLRCQYVVYGFIRLFNNQLYIIPIDIKNLCLTYLQHPKFKIYTQFEMKIARKYQNALQNKEVIERLQSGLRGVIQQGPEIQFRIEVLGSGGVGKSAITIRYVADLFLEEEYDPTIEDSYQKSVNMYGTKILLDILDTAGQQNFTALRDAYRREYYLFILVYSITSRDSFEIAQQFRENVVRRKEDCVQPYHMILVGNKVDLNDCREISFEEGFMLAEEWGIPFIECSAKTGENIEEIFKLLLMFKFNCFEEKSFSQTGCHCALL